MSKIVPHRNNSTKSVWQKYKTIRIQSAMENTANKTNRSLNKTNKTERNPANMKL